MTGQRKIEGGVYLVIDPALGLNSILPKIEEAIKGGISVLQVWNNWGNTSNKIEFIETICKAAHVHNIPVLINEDWELMLSTSLDGAHFDNIPLDLNQIRKTIARPFICGITCGNDLSHIDWAVDNNLNYISFCSMFPSASAGVCEIVTPETVTRARQLTTLPIFLAGGITLNNINKLERLNMDGVAVISAIMKADDVKTTAAAFKEKLQTIKRSR
jgi:thiamine-phosphate pyrophosphorylase